MTEADRIDRIARHLYDSHGARANFQNLTGDMALGSIDEAYQVQLALDRMWTSASRGPIGGYKIALTSKAIQDLVGVDKPCVGAIFASSIFHSPAEIPISKFVRLGLEFETAFRMGRELPEGETFDQYSISKYVDTAMAAFELIEDRNADYSNLDAATLIADNAWSGGIVLGPESKSWSKLDLTETPVTLIYNGKTEAALTGAALGNPLNALAWLATLLSGQGRSLKAGDVVMSGSTLATKFARAGDCAVYAIDGLGEVEVRITS